LFVMILDVVIVMVSASLFFDFNTSLASLPSLLPAILIISSVFILIGMSIGFIFKDEESSTIISVFISTILFLLSPIVIPLENMSLVLSKIAVFSPLVAGHELLRRIILFEIPISKLGLPVWTLIGYVVLLIFVMFLTHELHKKRL